MLIRSALPGDLESINLIYNQAVEERFCSAHLERVPMEEHRVWFGRHRPDRFPVYVAEKEGDIAGWISLSPYREGRQALSHVAEVSYYVHRNHRGLGLGSELMKHVLEVAPGFGFGTLIAILLGENLPSIALLERHGFRRWGVMPGIARIGKVRSDHLYYGLKIRE